MENIHLISACMLFGFAFGYLVKGIISYFQRPKIRTVQCSLEDFHKMMESIVGDEGDDKK